MLSLQVLLLGELFARALVDLVDLVEANMASMDARSTTCWVPVLINDCLVGGPPAWHEGRVGVACGWLVDGWGTEGMNL